MVGFDDSADKSLKGLRKKNLRDNMSMLELTFNQLAEVTTTMLSQEQKPQTFDENIKVARQGGGIAGDTRKAIEKASGKSVITLKKAVDFAQLLMGVVDYKVEKDDKDVARA